MRALIPALAVTSLAAGAPAPARHRDSISRDVGTHAALARSFEIAGSLDSARVYTMKALALDSLDPRSLELGRRLLSPTEASGGSAV